MRSLFQSPLFRKFALLMVGGIAVPIAILGFYFSLEIKKVLLLQDKAHLQSSIHFLAQSLRDPVWNFSKSEVVSSLGEFIQNENAIHLQVDSENGEKFVEVGRESDRSVDRTTGPDKGRHELISVPIVRGQKTIGTLRLTLGQSKTLRKLESTEYELLVCFGLLLLFLVLLLGFFFQKVIFGPLRRLKSQAESLEGGRRDHVEAWCENSEIAAVGRVLNFAQMAILENISNLEQKVKEQTSQVVQAAKLASLGEMSASIAHEINNPSAIIVGNVDRLERMTRPAPDQYEVWSGLTMGQLRKSILSSKKAIERITRIVKGMRAYARNGMDDAPVKVDARDLTVELTELCNAKFVHGGIDFKVEQTNEGSFELECQSVQVLQVLVNLCGNAADAIKDQSEKWIKLSLISNDAQNMIFEVTDSGKGISEEVESKIFQPFFTTKAVGEGTGLGLSISQSIVRKHGGKIEIVRPHANTCFRITLPRKAQIEISAKAA